MQRPPSILLFERLYLGSLLVYIVGLAAFWTRMQATVAAMPQMQANPSMGSFVVATMIGSAVVVAAVTLLLWWLVTRQRSQVGKWLVVATEAIGALMALFSLVALARGTTPNPAGAVVNLIATGLAIAAAVVLLRPDARVWLGEGIASETLP